MRRQLFGLAVVLSALGLLVQSAEAGGRRDKRLVVASVVTGAAATTAFFALTDWRWHHSWSTRTSSGLTVGGAYAATTVGCMAAAPIVGTLMVNRPLTSREVHTMFGSCIIPIIGGWLVDAAYNANPHWEAAPAPTRVVRVKKRRK